MAGTTCRRVVFTLFATAIAGGLLALRISVPPDNADLVGRYWEDVEIAAGYFAHHEFPVSTHEIPASVTRSAAPTDYSRFREQVMRIPRWMFWKTAPFVPDGGPSLLVARTDDSGRPLLLGLLFRAVGGVAPWMLCWAAFFVCLPVIAWLCWELHAAGAPVASLAAAFLIGASMFVADTLRTAYSPVGFYLVGVIAVAAYAAFTCMSARPSVRGLIARSGIAGVCLAIAIAGRSGSALLAGGLCAALAVGLRGVWISNGRHWRSVLATAAAATGLLACPPLLAKAGLDHLVASTFARHGYESAPPQSHAVWIGIWEGLGDFDRTKDHDFDDQSALMVCVQAGGTTKGCGGDYYDPSNERAFRRLVLADITNDPAWFASILGKRLFATTSQVKLWPWTLRDGRSSAPRSHFNEGKIDAYYDLTRRIDWFGIEPIHGELPITLLIGPTILLLLMAAARWRPAPVPRGAALLLLCMAVATLPFPVLITTASALETQAFALMYLLGAALLAQAATPMIRGLYLRRPSSDTPALENRWT